MLPVRWEPGREILRLERFMDHMMRHPFERPRLWPAIWDDRARPALDIYETPEQVVVKATVPGVKSKDMEVTVTGDALVIRGEAKEERESKEERYFLRERSHGAFHRAVVLPEGLDTDKIEATVKNGVLRLVLPKSKAALPRKIKVTSE